MNNIGYIFPPYRKENIQKSQCVIVACIELDA